VFGDEVPLRARVEVLGGYSAHGDRHELQQWLDHVRADGRPTGQTGAAPDVYLVHGEPEAQDAFAAQLHSGGYPSVHAPTPHQKIVL
jgi:metallo-beta-lactamase family protein